MYSGAHGRTMILTSTKLEANKLVFSSEGGGRWGGRKWVGCEDGVTEGDSLSYVVLCTLKFPELEVDVRTRS